MTTLAGSQEGGFAEGPSKEARFSGAVGLAADAQGNVYVADSGNRRVRMIASNGSVSTLAGSGQRGHEDGPAQKASFDIPVGIALGRDSSIYVLDYDRDHPRVRRIGPGSNIKTIATVN